MANSIAPVIPAPRTERPALYAVAPCSIVRGKTIDGRLWTRYYDANGMPRITKPDTDDPNGDIARYIAAQEPRLEM